MKIENKSVLIDLFYHIMEEEGDYIGTRHGRDYAQLVVNREDPYFDKMGMSLDEVGETLGLFEEWGYNDSFTFCPECNDVLDLSSLTEYVVHRDCLSCLKCAEEYAEEIIEEHVDNPRKALTVFKDKLEGMGFIKRATGVNDWYGTHDDPQKMYEKEKEEWNEVVFTLERVSMFSTEFAMYTRMVG